MRVPWLALSCVAALTMFAPGHLVAQYLYMDSNGNGIHDSGDRVAKKGVTSVDVYLVSNANEDGSVATCNNNWVTPELPIPNPLRVFSFGLAFKAVGGTVSWGEFTQVPSTFEFLYSAVTTDTEHHVFFFSHPDNPQLEPGKIFLGSIDIQVTSGSPSLEFQPTIQLPNGSSETTSFGTPCLGLDWDNTYKLGSDFFDTDGLAAAGSPAAASSSRILVSPNPMNPTAKIAFQTTRAGRVRIQLFDLNGRLVRTVVDASSMPAGSHEVLVDGKNHRGADLGSGIYFVRIESADGVSKGRVTLAR